jgi:hypothetical protein
MRADNHTTWLYEEKTKKFRLSNIYKNYYGDATNNESGIQELDLLRNTFTADWNYWDAELDSLISIPTITLYLYNPPIYLNDTMLVKECNVDSIFSFYKNQQMINMRIAAISQEKLLQAEIPLFNFSELTDKPIDVIISESGVEMQYDKNQQFVVAADSVDEENNRYVAHIIALPQYKQYMVYILSFVFESNKSAIVIYLLDKERRCSDSHFFWYEREENIYFTINKNYGIDISKEVKQEKAIIEKYSID